MTEGLETLLGLKPGDVVSLTGSGGKTTLMERLGASLGAVSRVLMTTTTKILPPFPDRYHAFFDTPAARVLAARLQEGARLPQGVYLAADSATLSQAVGREGQYTAGAVTSFDAVCHHAKAGKPLAPPAALLQAARACAGMRKTESGPTGATADPFSALSAYKLGPVQADALQALIPFFDVTLAEADGSRMLPLKGWCGNEPVPAPGTTVTVGVMPVFPLGHVLDGTMAYRLEAFCSLAHMREGDLLRPEHLARVIAADEGLFARCPGRRVIFFSQVEDESSVRLAQKVFEALPSSWKETVNAVVAGSAIRNSGVCLWSHERL